MESLVTIHHFDYSSAFPIQIAYGAFTELDLLPPGHHSGSRKRGGQFVQSTSFMISAVIRYIRLRSTPTVTQSLQSSVRREGCGGGTTRFSLKDDAYSYDSIVMMPWNLVNVDRLMPLVFPYGPALRNTN